MADPKKKAPQAPAIDPSNQPLPDFAVLVSEARHIEHEALPTVRRQLEYVGEPDSVVGSSDEDFAQVSFFEVSSQARKIDLSPTVKGFPVTLPKIRATALGQPGAQLLPPKTEEERMLRTFGEAQHDAASAPQATISPAPKKGFQLGPFSLPFSASKENKKQQEAAGASSFPPSSQPTQILSPQMQMPQEKIQSPQVMPSSLQPPAIPPQQFAASQEKMQPMASELELPITKEEREKIALPAQPPATLTFQPAAAAGRPPTSGLSPPSIPRSAPPQEKTGETPAEETEGPFPEKMQGQERTQPSSEKIYRATTQMKAGMGKGMPQMKPKPSIMQEGAPLIRPIQFLEEEAETEKTAQQEEGLRPPEDAPALEQEESPRAQEEALALPKPEEGESSEDESASVRLIKKFKTMGGMLKPAGRAEAAEMPQGKKAAKKEMPKLQGKKMPKAKKSVAAPPEPKAAAAKKLAAQKKAEAPAEKEETGITAETKAPTFARKGLRPPQKASSFATLAGQPPQVEINQPPLVHKPLRPAAEMEINQPPLVHKESRPVSPKRIFPKAAPQHSGQPEPEAQMEAAIEAEEEPSAIAPSRQLVMKKGRIFPGRARPLQGGAEQEPIQKEAQEGQKETGQGQEEREETAPVQEGAKEKIPLPGKKPASEPAEKEFVFGEDEGISPEDLAKDGEAKEEKEEAPAPPPPPQKISTSGAPVLGVKPPSNEMVQGATVLTDEIYFAYARERAKWIYDIYKIGGMTLDEFRAKIREKMAEDAGKPKQEPGTASNPALQNLNKELEKKFKK